MSTRRQVATTPAAAPSDRLRTVLQAGLREQERDTGVAIVPTAPGVVNPIPAPTPFDPSAWKEAGKPLPFLYQERRTFPRAVWDAIPKDQQDRIDPYGNVASFEFDRLSGQEVLRSVKLKGGWSRSAPKGTNPEHLCGAGWLDKIHDHVPSPIGGTMYFNGAPGKEYATAWVDAMNNQYIKFDGTDRDSQTIDSMELSLKTAKGLTDTMPPPLEGNPFLNKQRDLYNSAHEYARILRGFTSQQGFDSSPEMVEQLTRDFNAITSFEINVDFATRIKIDGTNGVRFHYDKGRELTRRMQESIGGGYGLARTPDVVTYYPTTQPGGWLMKGEIAAVVQMDGAVYTYRREANGDLVIDPSSSSGDLSKAPERFEYQDKQFGPKDSYPLPPDSYYKKLLQDAAAKGKRAFVEELDKWTVSKFHAAATVMTNLVVFALCSVFPNTESAQGKRRFEELMAEKAELEEQYTTLHNMWIEELRKVSLAKNVNERREAQDKVNELLAKRDSIQDFMPHGSLPSVRSQISVYWRDRDTAKERKSAFCAGASVLAGALYYGYNM